MKILITGVAGFIGSHVCKKLLDNGHTVYGLDNYDNFYETRLKKIRIEILKKNKNFFFFNIDLCDIKSLKARNFDLMINLAAQAGVRLPAEMHFKYHHSNIDGFQHFLDFSNQVNCNNLIYASSSSVYSSSQKIPYKENQKLEIPLSKYAESKIINEEYAADFAIDNDKKIIGLRFFTVYGPMGRPDMAYYNFTKRIIQNKEITLYNEGKTFRDMTYIDDIVNGIILAKKFLSKESFSHEIFNLGNENPINTHYLVTKIEKEFKKNALIKYISNKNEVKMTKADCSKAKLMLGYCAETPFEKGIKHFFDWFKKYYGV